MSSVGDDPLFEEIPAGFQLKFPVSVIVVVAALVIELPHLLLEHAFLSRLKSSRVNYIDQTRTARSTANRDILQPRRRIFVISWVVFVVMLSILHGFGIEDSEMFVGNENAVGTDLLVSRNESTPTSPNTDWAMRCTEIVTVNNGTQDLTQIIRQSVNRTDPEKPSFCTGRNGSDAEVIVSFLREQAVGVARGPTCPIEPCSSAADCESQLRLWVAEGGDDRATSVTCSNSEIQSESTFACRAVGDKSFCDGNLTCVGWWYLLCNYSSEDHKYVSLIADAPLHNVSVLFNGSLSPWRTFLDDVLSWRNGSVTYYELVEVSHVTRWAIVVTVLPLVVMLIVHVNIIWLQWNIRCMRSGKSQPFSFLHSSRFPSFNFRVKDDHPRQTSGAPYNAGDDELEEG